MPRRSVILHCTKISGMVEPSLHQAGVSPVADKVQLKKYSNRRLYASEEKSFVTLGQVAGMIRQGRQVEVLDADTGQDVTPYILAQIIAEEAKSEAARPPLTLLYLIIRYGEAFREFFDKYLGLTFKNYLAHKASAEEQFRQWLASGKNVPGVANVQGAQVNAAEAPAEGNKLKK